MISLKERARMAWGVMVRTRTGGEIGPMGCVSVTRPPELGAYMTMAFTTRALAREWCRAHTYRRGSRVDGWFHIARPVRIEIAVRFQGPKP